MNPKIYLDTTVPSAYFDERARYRQELTQQFWNERLPVFTPVISSLVLREILDTPDLAKRDRIIGLIAGFEILPFSVEADALSREYVRRGIFAGKYAPDGEHVATATVHGVGYFVSWNFRHLVKVKTRREINLVNSLMGYAQIEIVAPPEL